MALFDFDIEPIKKPVIAEEQKKLIKKRNVSYEELFHMNKTTTDILGYDDFTAEKYPYGLVFHDFEVFMYDWLVVLIDPIAKTKTIIVNNRAALREYYELHKDCIWVGYNNKHYDTPIFKGILCGYDPKEISDKLIVEGKKPFELYREYDFSSIEQFYVYDVMVKKVPPESLKLLEAFMGNDIEETEVDFNLDRPLTKEEVFKTIRYCIHDVEQTIEVFRYRISDFEAQIALVETFNLPFKNVSRTKGQLTAIIVDCKKQEHDDEFDVTFLPCIQLDKYSYVQDWFKGVLKNKDYKSELPNTPENRYILSKGEQVRKNKDSKTSFVTDVCGIPHTFGWGGLHGCPDKPVHIFGNLYHSDIGSYYPSSMIGWDFLTRNCRSPNKFKEVYDTRMALKKAGKKKEQAPYKVILNSQYGITKDRNSEAYDPVQANNICVNGMLMILDLLEKLESRLGDRFQLIQANTDGIVVKLAEDERTEKIYRHICDEWCLRTKLTFAHEEWGGIVQKDVNNYVAFSRPDENGNMKVIEQKGSFVKENNPLDNDLPILNEAMVNYISKNIPVEDTINNCNELIKFQNIYRLSGDAKAAWHNGEYFTDKTYRIFASVDSNDTYLGKCKEIGGKPDKFQDTPEHCFIYNKSVKDIPMSIKLDRKWYINMAKKRLEQYGYQLQKSNELF